MNRAAELTELAWLSGWWKGRLGPLSVEEHWSAAEGDSMSTMVRVMAGPATELIELILIEAHAGSVRLQLRQFHPDLSPRHAQTMALDEVGEQRVRFAGAADDKFSSLEYRLQDAQTLEVAVARTDGSSARAVLKRQ